MSFRDRPRSVYWLLYLGDRYGLLASSCESAVKSNLIQSTILCCNRKIKHTRYVKGKCGYSLLLGLSRPTMIIFHKILYNYLTGLK